MTATPSTLTVFIPCRLVNEKNRREHWAPRAKRAKAQREAVAMEVYYALNGADYLSGKSYKQTAGMKGAWRITAKPSQPKRITLTAHVVRKWDTDGLVSALSHVRDGLQDCGLIHDDGPDSGHVFTYTQRVAKPTGVEITISLKEAR